jgi:UDP-N-acetylglucosamine diphosphorylase/glucosamine-1-phosphate N-acetyltransferase
LIAVVLAAGEGSRMRPLTYTRPKVMLPIANRPILEHLIVESREAGIKDFVLVVGYHDEQIRSYFGNGRKWSVNVAYANQRKQLGTADAVRMVEGTVDGDFLLMNGDTVVNRKDIRALAENGRTTISTIEVKDPKGLGTVEVRRGRVLRIHEKVEKPPTNLANAGLYFFTPDIFAAISQTPKSPRGEYEITSSLQIMIDNGQRVLSHRLGYWLDLSYPWHLLEANEALLNKMDGVNAGTIEANVTMNGMVSIGEGTRIRSGAYIVGPVLIGRNCDIGPNCFIRPYTAIGDGCHIGAAVEVKNSIVMGHSKIPHLNYVGDSVIGEDCNLGAGTKIANLRLDEREIAVAGINTGRRKLGAVLGDRVKTGINASINVGTMIGNDSFIGPGAVVSGIVSPDSQVF